MIARISSSLVVGAAWVLTGARARWVGCEPSPRPRIYYANHGSHLDFVVIWSALPPELRPRTRPVAGRDYWRSGLKRYLAENVFHAVLIDRRTGPDAASRHASIEAAKVAVNASVAALDGGSSLILFPEGTRSTTGEVGPFKAGLFHVSRQRPEVELVPTFLENLSRILPKGEFLPVPLMGSVTFGQPLRFEAGETKDAFLARTRDALLALEAA